MELFYDLEKMECFYELEKLEFFYDLEKLEFFYGLEKLEYLEKLSHFLNSIYSKPMKKIEERMRECMENGAKEEEEEIPSMHQEISNHIL